MVYIGIHPLFYTLELSQKSDFQPLTTKSDNIGHPTVEIRQIWPGFQGGFVFFKKIKILIRFKKSKLIYFKLEKMKLVPKFF